MYERRSIHNTLYIYSTRTCSTCINNDLIELRYCYFLGGRLLQVPGRGPNLSLRLILNITYSLYYDLGLVKVSKCIFFILVKEISFDF